MLSKFSSDGRSDRSSAVQMLELELPAAGQSVDYLIVCDDDPALGRAVQRTLPHGAGVARLMLPQRHWDFADADLRRAIQEQVQPLAPAHVLLVSHSELGTSDQRAPSDARGGMFERVLDRQKQVGEVRRFTFEQLRALREGLKSTGIPAIDAAIYRAESGLVLAFGASEETPREAVAHEGGAQ